ncbi:Type-2 restriction enzyme DdeI [uncultured spirochete]|uniref:Type-2 restriction enzyme DdeI n=1 Tax=uncultured spirochete TaxID=156406 RepID=A0A3P3XLP7_9SPIR|nr:Type-2 restriction enzyme DdeI [uncultured spirochete]
MPYNIGEIQKAYNILVGGIDDKANAENDEGSRAYGGVVRSAKGILVEGIAKNLVEIAWNELGGHPSRLSFQKETIRIPLKPEYLKRVRPAEVAEYIKAHIQQYFYGHKTDVHVSIDGQFVMGIECKAYTENAMLKRILVDFTLLKQVVPNLKCVLLQLESQLTGDYSQPLKPIIYGSPSSHTLLSYFNVDLNIVTLLEGERKVDEPIHKKPYFKPMTEQALIKAVETLKKLLSEFVVRK